MGGSIFVNLYDRGDKVVISIKDTGLGIPNDKQQIIFERFRQVNKSLNRRHEGSGIGLSIVKSLVKMHGGYISVKSELGQGSEFFVELPAQVLPGDTIHKNTRIIEDSNSNKEKVNIEFSDIYF
jgi:signal transduction histidine kinase